MALVFYKEQKYDRAIDVCDQALEFDPECHKAMFHKGRALNDKTEWQKAIDIFKKMVDLATRKAEEKAKKEAGEDVKEADVDNGEKQEEVAVEIDTEGAAAAKEAEEEEKP